MCHHPSSLQQPCEGATSIISAPILMGEGRLKGMKWLAQDHNPCEWKSQRSHLGSLPTPAALCCFPAAQTPYLFIFGIKSSLSLAFIFLLMPWKPRHLLNHFSRPQFWSLIIIVNIVEGSDGVKYLTLIVPFTDKEREAQRSYITCKESPSW